MADAPKHTPGPWVAKAVDYLGRSWSVSRTVGPGQFEFLGADGESRANPSLFHSEAGASAAIAKAEGRS